MGHSAKGGTCVPAGMAASGSVLPTAMGASGPARSTAPAAMRCGASTYEYAAFVSTARRQVKEP